MPSNPEANNQNHETEQDGFIKMAHEMPSFEEHMRRLDTNRFLPDPDPDPDSEENPDPWEPWEDPEPTPDPESPEPTPVPTPDSGPEDFSPEEYQRLIWLSEHPEAIVDVEAARYVAEREDYKQTDAVLKTNLARAKAEYILHQNDRDSKVRDEAQAAYEKAQDTLYNFYMKEHLGIRNRLDRARGAIEKIDAFEKMTREEKQENIQASRDAADRVGAKAYKKYTETQDYLKNL